MNCVKICDHVKSRIQTNDLTNEKICQIETNLQQQSIQIGDLLSKLDKMDELLTSHNEDIRKFKENEFITVTQLSEVVEDVKESFENILTLTPRNNDDVKLVTTKLELLEKKLFDLEGSMGQNIRLVEPKIPKINLAFRKKKE